MSGANTYNGGTFLNGGVLQVGSSAALPATSPFVVSGGTLDVHGFNASVGALTGGVIDNLLGSGTLNVGGGGANSTFAGTILDTVGSLTFNKVGAGLLTLTGSITTIAPTVVSAGTLQVGDGATTNGYISGNIVDNAVLAFAPPFGQTYSGQISGSGALNSTGILYLTGSNTYSGQTTVLSGTLFAPVPSAIPNVIGGGSPVVLVKSGAGLTIPVGGAGQWTAANVAALLQSPSTTFQSGATLGLDTTGGNFVYGSNITNPNLGINIFGGNKVTFTGANTYTGITTITSGTLQLGDGISHNGEMASNIVNNSALIFANPFNQTYAGVISGFGPVTKTGAGNLTITTSQTYLGATYVNNGTLRLGFPGISIPLAGFGADTSGNAATINNGTWTFNTVLTTATPVTGGTLTLTDGVNSEGRTAFFNSPVSVTQPFTATFTYLPTVGADGIAFILQNDTRGLTAIGPVGGGFAYGATNNPGTNISPSAAVEINIYNGHVQGTNYTTNGAAVANFNATGSVNVASGDPIQITVSYDGTNILTESLKDLTTSATYSTTYTVGSLASVVSGNTAFVGFSGATGGVNATQKISNFTSTFGVSINNINLLPVTTDLFVAAGGTLDLSGGAQQVDSISGAGVVTNSVAGRVALLTNSGGLSTTFSGLIKDDAGQLALAVGSGTLTLSGTGAYTGGTTVNTGGVLVAANPGAIASGTNLSVGDPVLLSTLQSPVVPSSPVAAASAATAVPEPGTLAMLVLGAGVALGACWRRRWKR
jgi:autotransporter-associated beta strand protein